MKKLITYILGGFVALIIFIYSIYLIDLLTASAIYEPSHHHKFYKRTWANGVKSSIIEVCGDTTIVMNSGKHIGFIPDHLKRYITKDNEVR